MNENQTTYQYYYEPALNAFAVSPIHEISEQAIPVSEDDYFRLSTLQQQGHVLYINSDNQVAATAETSPSPYHHWTGTEWQADETEYLAYAKDMASARIEEAYENHIGTALASTSFYTAFDEHTRNLLEAEMDNPESEGILLETYCHYAGIPVERFKPLFKEDCYRLNIARVRAEGIRVKHCYTISKLTDPAEINAMHFSFEDEDV